MGRVLQAVLIVALVVVVAACGGQPPAPQATPVPRATPVVPGPNPQAPTAVATPWPGQSGVVVPTPEVAVSSLKREMAPAAASKDLAAQVEGNGAFACDLYRALRGNSGNLFYSPFSMSLALAMTYAGARGQTEQEMAKTLHYVLPQSDLHRAFNALDLSLQGNKTAPAGKAFQLSLVNSAWGQRGYPLTPQYLDAMASNYGAGLRLVDFKQATELSRAAINDWVSQQTNGKIKDLLGPQAITPDTRLALVNAIYFNADWAEPFSKEATRPAPFTLLDGRKVDVPMMPKETRLFYAREQGYEMVELPYVGGTASLVFLVPPAGGFEQLESGLTFDVVNRGIRDLSLKKVALMAPKFKFESQFSLVDVLAKMGMPTAKTPGKADFSGISETKELYIGAVEHKAVVAVDEKGTEAAAATAVSQAAGAAPPKPEETIRLVIDRPFLFLIRDVGTGTVLFLGVS